MARILQVLVIVALVGWTASAFAAGDCALCAGAASDGYVMKTMSQGSRGIANVGGCWLEFVNQPMRQSQNGNVMVGILTAPGHAIVRCAKGVGEILTCPLPKTKEGKYMQMTDDCPLCMWETGTSS